MTTQTYINSHDSVNTNAKQSIDWTRLHEHVATWIIESGYDMTDWEKSFLDTVFENKHGRLSPKQWAVLGRMIAEIQRRETN